MPDNKAFIISEIPVNCQLGFPGNLKTIHTYIIKFSKTNNIIFLQTTSEVKILKIIKVIFTLFTMILLFKHFIQLKIQVKPNTYLVIISYGKKEY